MQLAFDFSAAAPGIVRAAAPPVDPRRDPAGKDNQPRDARAHRGTANHLGGQAAETSVARAYMRSGRQVCATRYRGTYGEVDLIVRDGATLVFVEVKKSRFHDQARHRVSRQQFERIYATAAEYVETQPEGPLAEMRFDLATVDAIGTVEIHPGMLAHF